MPEVRSSQKPSSHSRQDLIKDDQYRHQEEKKELSPEKSTVPKQSRSKEDEVVVGKDTTSSGLKRSKAAADQDTALSSGGGTGAAASAPIAPVVTSLGDERHSTLSLSTTQRVVSIASSLSSPAQVTHRSSLSRSTKNEDGKKGDDDADDVIASIAASSKVKASQVEPVKCVDREDEVVAVGANSADESGETIDEQASSQQQTETVLHTRDIKMTDDDALLGDIPWTVEQHQAFVAAIFEIGLKTCSPSVIMENMRKRPRYVTRERTKSHLQKYRMTKDRNKDDFMTEYIDFMKKTETIKKQMDATRPTPIPKVVLSKALEGKKAAKLIGGQAAALLSFSVLNNCSTDHGPDQIPFQGTTTTLPQMTEEEKQTSLGASILYIKGLLHNMTDVLLKERHGLYHVAASDTKEYDSQSSSSEEDYSDYDEDERDERELVTASDPSRKPSPLLVEAATSKQQRASKMPNRAAFGYHRIYEGGHPPHGQYPPPAFPGQSAPGYHPPFPPFAFGGPPQRHMQPSHGHFPPPHPANFNQGPYGHPPPPPMVHYPPGHAHSMPYHGPADASHSSFQPPPPQHSLPQTSSAFPTHFANMEPYPDLPEEDSYESHPDGVVKRSRPTRPERISSESSKYKDRHQKTDNGYDLGRQANLFASPLVPDRKRKRKLTHVGRIAALDASMEIDEDRGIPGASKVASPFNERRHSPVRPKVRSHRRHDSQSRDQSKREPKSRRSTLPLLIESPLKEVFKSVKDKDQHVLFDQDLSTQQETPQSASKSSPPDKNNLSPDMLFADEPHLSPGDMSMVSKMSHDGHQIVWEPLAIDMHEHFMDQDNFLPPSGKVDLKKASKIGKTSKKRNFDDTPDSPDSTSKRAFFSDNDD